MTREKKVGKIKKPRLILHSVLVALTLVLLAGAYLLSGLANSFSGVFEL